MITYKTGDIFKEETEAIVNTVNCIGAMGQGLALQFKEWFPNNFIAYKAVCKQKEILLGKMFVYETRLLISPAYIINFPTKQHWREITQIEDIKSGLQDLVKIIVQLRIKSIALPPFGCELDGLNWDKVRACIENAFVNLTDVEVIIFKPKSTSEIKKY